MPDYNGALAAEYGRVSTDDQQNSLAMQDEKRRAYAAFKGLTIREDLCFLDEDISGTVEIAKRPNGSKLMDVLKSGQVKHLIILKLDRLGRNAVDIQATWKHLTKDLGITIHVIDLGGDSFASDSPITRFIVGMLALFAELEVENIRSRIRDVLNHKFKAGEQTGSVPFGFDAKPTGRIHKRKNGTEHEIKRLVPNLEEQKWLIRIVEWRLIGWSFRAIAAELNSHKVPAKNGGNWQPGTVHAVLNNRFTQKVVNEVKRQFKAAHTVTEGDDRDVRETSVPSGVCERVQGLPDSAGETNGDVPNDLFGQAGDVQEIPAGVLG